MSSQTWASAELASHYALLVSCSPGPGASLLSSTNLAQYPDETRYRTTSKDSQGLTGVSDQTPRVSQVVGRTNRRCACVCEKGIACGVCRPEGSSGAARCPEWLPLAMFREQVNSITAQFEQWNECEQTVALYALLKRLTPAKARFLSLALDQSLANCVELQLHEHQANNSGYISSLLAEPKEVAIAQLLVHLPLLRPGNVETKTRYMTVINLMLSHAVETGANVKEAQQLLCYSFIHPAISSEDRSSLARWMRQLEDRIRNGGGSRMQAGHDSSPQHWGGHQQHHYHRPTADSHFLAHNSNSTPSSSSQGNMAHYTNGSHPRMRRSNSLTPPVSITQATGELWSSQDDLSGRQKPRSFSLSSEHAPPLSPQSSLASSGSGSESHLDDLRLGFNSDTWLKDVPAWLKSLRLHKYVWVFVDLSYEDMLDLTEQKLATRGEVLTGENLGNILEELKAILISPMKAAKAEAAENEDEKEREETEITIKKETFLTNGKADDSHNFVCEENIPKALTRVLGKVFSHLLVSPRTEEEHVRVFVALLDRSLQHESFTVQQKKQLTVWRVRIQEAWQHVLPVQHKSTEQRQPRQKWHHHCQFPPSTNQNTYTHGHPLPHPIPHPNPHLHHGGCRSPRFPPPPPPPPSQQQFTRPTTAGYGGSLYANPGPQHRNSLSVLGTTGGGVAAMMAKRPSLQDPLTESQTHSTLQRTSSAPMKPVYLSSLDVNNGAVDPEINSRLESLCLSMTEHALGGCGEI
uniref:SMAUG/ZCCHC2-like PHAT domain-containing protein n=2 Tax=Timema TaxID=61471 RepID=A0A7R9DYL7_9NEOP|nr:unnamed protein product [Timema monikensis]